MDIQDLNKSQLILLAVLLSFITSIATGITTVTLMQQAPPQVTVPVDRVIRQTVEKIVPVQSKETLSADQKELLENLKAIRPLTVTLVVKDQAGDRLLGTGLFLGDNKAVISSVVAVPGEGETYAIKSALGEQIISKVIPQSDFTVVELAPSGTTTDTETGEEGGQTPVTPENS